MVFQVVSYFWYTIVVTASFVHVFNAVDCSIVFVLVLVLELDTFHEGPNDITTQSFDVEDIAGPDVSVVYFLFV